MNTYCLFEGRHELPPNEGALCSGFDFTLFKATTTALWDKALNELEKGESISIYVTGLTPALTQFLAEADRYIWEAGLYDNSSPIRKGFVYLLHFNSQTGEYVKQIF